ncbi:NACHT domain-containing protein [Streptomyces sp. NBC_00038]|uniref:NACHT domain-containing protein n=1 Tax=Streptomyces sp. NBC_00038 TaxID=2903615 RepID=UPI00224DA4EF|nr:NACHT domain-containing protein [Streptomyces sp. NBC_00038]MCX5562858.1 NACHT domain-containing protein [Streptomyces sp. NBC_00038]
MIGLFGVLAVWAWRRDPQRGYSSSGQLADATAVLARLVGRQWQEEATLRQLFDPAPLPVVWSDCPEAGVGDHRQLIGAPFSCCVDRTEELACAFRALPRRRLVALGPAGSGKTTFAVLLTLGLLRTREENDPVPVLLSLASFDPARESAHGWLSRRLAADYPALADAEAYGPTAIDDLLAGHHVLPVLDGLDELPVPAHTAVLTALNDTLDAHTPLVLTCRTSAYTTAVTHAGVLAGAAVIEPTPVRPVDALALLRLATSPGPRHERWDELTRHVSRHPDGPVARALASPLMVGLARAVYADADGDPSELADRGRFPTSGAIEHHLLDALVPALYARAHRLRPADRRWDPACAQRYLTHLADGLRRQDTHDLTWWQLYRWTPLAHAWSRAALSAFAAFTLIWAGYLFCNLTGAGPSDWQLEVVLWYSGAVALAMAGMLCVAAWMAARPRTRAGSLQSVLLIAACGYLAHSAPKAVWRMAHTSIWAGVEYILVASTLYGLSYLAVLYTAGSPVPPDMPSRGRLGTLHWRHRLPRALATVVGTAILTGTALNIQFVTAAPWLPLGVAADSIPPLDAWAYGLTAGLLFGTVQALLRWMRHTVSPNDLTTAASSVRADRIISLLTGTAGAVLITLPDIPLWMSAAGVFPEDVSIAILTAGYLWSKLPLVGPAGLVLALAACAWPYYTAARILLAARGRLPWRLQPFLADAHRLGILRQVGPVYQFRHAHLQHRLADRAHLPHPRTAPRPARSRSRTRG